MTPRIGVLLLACVLTALTSCSSFHARAYGAYMKPRLRGDAALSPTAAVPATVDIDFQDDLGQTADEMPYFRADAGFLITNLSFSAFRYVGSGDGTLSGQFGNISAGVPVNTDIDLLNIRSALTFNLIDVGPLRVAPGLAIDYTDFDMTVNQSGTAIFEQIQVRVPAPLAFVQAELELGDFAANVDFGAMQVDLRDVDGTYLDFEGMLRYSPLPKLEIMGGYRLITIDGDGIVDGQPYAVDIQIDGWYIGGGVSF